MLSKVAVLYPYHRMGIRLLLVLHGMMVTMEMLQDMVAVGETSSDAGREGKTGRCSEPAGSNHHTTTTGTAQILILLSPFRSGCSPVQPADGLRQQVGQRHGVQRQFTRRRTEAVGDEDRLQGQRPKAFGGRADHQGVGGRHFEGGPATGF